MFVRGVAAKLGSDSYVEDLSNVGTKGLCLKTCEVLMRIDKLCLDIAGDMCANKVNTDIGRRLLVAGEAASKGNPAMLDGTTQAA